MEVFAIFNHQTKWKSNLAAMKKIRNTEKMVALQWLPREGLFKWELP